MLSVKVQGNLDSEQQYALSRKLWALREVRTAVRKASLATERNVKIRMPRDTGRAAASWGHWTPGDLRDAKGASAGDAYYKEEDDGLTITQGSNVEYVGRLNDGWSKQAPAGFIDAAAERGMEALDDEIDYIMRAF